MFFWTVCAARMPTVGVLGVAAGVEEIDGLDGPVPSGSGADMLLGSRTATPQGFLWCGSMPMRSSRRPLDAWWNVWRVAV